ncbi:MAG TPA: hypothetical protein VG125_07030, partial [Pirellulales bacterium]|nr:hypothetical protein [Pirellulales bacterium]
DHASVDPFWRTGALLLIQAIVELLHYHPERACTLKEIQGVLRDPEPLRQLVDEGKSHQDRVSESCLRSISGFLNYPDLTRDSFLAVAYQAIRGAGAPSLSACCTDTTFSLDELTSGEPLTIYVEVQAQRTTWQMTLARCWLKALLEFATLGKRSLPPMIVVDSPISYESFFLLSQFQLGADVDLWTFFSDAQLMERTFPADWPGFLMNASRIDFASKLNR